MAELRSALQAAGVDVVATVGASGNVLLRQPPGARITADEISGALHAGLGLSARTILRTADQVDAHLAVAEGVTMLPGERCLVTFVGEEVDARTLEIAVPDGVRILARTADLVVAGVSAEPRKASGLLPALERALGPGQTTRTLGTVRRVAVALSRALEAGGAA